MIGLAWQRRVRMAAMRLPATNSPQSDGPWQRPISPPSAGRMCRVPLKRLSFLLFYAGRPRQVMRRSGSKGAEAHQLNRKAMPFHIR